jgi:tetratricopeptide (TPR) repeat protein
MDVPRSSEASGSPGLTPVVFVAMPFGRKSDPTRTFEIDFDDIYERAIRPAVEHFDVDCIRADKERSGGVIHLAMFERLLLAEVAIVDVTLSNPNVFYELGVRHGARPRSTIIVGSAGGSMPFDIAMIRALPYQLHDGRLEDADAAVFVEGLIERLRYALEEIEAKDSPLFQLIPGLPEQSLPHEITESFRDRARTIDGIRERLESARHLADTTEAVRQIGEIERSYLAEITKVNAELLFDVYLSYRDVKAWDEMIALGERSPPWLQMSVPTLHEQLAFALNRRNGPGDRARAIALLEAIIKKQGDSPETSSLLARVYKDEYVAALAGGERLRAGGSLTRAIDLYRRGFNADPRDYYPGVNLATLLALKGTPEAKNELAQIVPALTFALGRLGGLNSSDYWQLATVLEISVLGRDADGAMRALEIVASLDEQKTKPWMFETTANNMRLLQSAGDSIDQAMLAEVIAELDRRGGA